MPDVARLFKRVDISWSVAVAGGPRVVVSMVHLVANASTNHFYKVDFGHLVHFHSQFTSHFFIVVIYGELL